MGPTIILDKSAFQALSSREHMFLERCFTQNLTPILAMELLGDLSKEKAGPRGAGEKVKELANKFMGSGPATNIDYRTLCMHSLLGNHIPMRGSIIPQSSRVVRDAE